MTTQLLEQPTDCLICEMRKVLNHDRTQELKGIGFAFGIAVFFFVLGFLLGGK